MTFMPGLRHRVGAALRILSALAVTVPLVTGNAFADQQRTVLLDQTVSTGGVTARAIVEDVGLPLPLININFSAETRSTYPIGCLSVFQDLRYLLRDRMGRLIPIDEGRLHSLRRPYSNFITVNTMVTPPPDCAQWLTYTQSITVERLYPNLPDGNYTLELILAPRLRTSQAAFRPFPFSLYD